MLLRKKEFARAWLSQQRLCRQNALDSAVFSIGFHSGCYASWAWMRVVVAAARGRLGLQNLQGGVKAAA